MEKLDKVNVFKVDEVKVLASWMCLAKAFHRGKGDRGSNLLKLQFYYYIYYNIYNNKDFLSQLFQEELKTFLSYLNK